MSKEQQPEGKPDFKLEDPLLEDEGSSGREHPPHPNNNNTAPLNPKDSRAFWLAVICLGCLAILYLISLLSNKPINVTMSFEASFVDILKYVITTSLGFFFATTMSKKN